MTGGHNTPSVTGDHNTPSDGLHSQSLLAGPYTDEALQVVTKFPMVTIEKGQQVFDGAPFAEDVILETLKRVKEINSNISTIFCAW
jgi:hypothetical protein